MTIRVLLADDHALMREGSVTPRYARSPVDSLSTRERQVLQLVVEGKTSSEIARMIHLSPRSVQNVSQSPDDEAGREGRALAGQSPARVAARSSQCVIVRAKELMPKTGSGDGATEKQGGPEGVMEFQRQEALLVCCCSMYWRIIPIGAPPQLPAK